MTALADLTDADLELHARLGISDVLLAAAGVRRVSDAEARALLGVNHRGDLSGLLYPRLDPVSGRPFAFRVRRDHPEMEGGRPRAKYIASVDRHRLYLPPGLAVLLDDISVTAVIVEAEKSALALFASAQRTDRQLLPIGIGGCWGWRGRIGKVVDSSGARVDEHGPLSDLDRIAWADRDVVIVFDGDVTNNVNVANARRALARELSDRGACIRSVDVPVSPNVNGPDDYLAVYGEEALWTLVDGATADPTGRPRPVIVRLADVRQESVRWLWQDRLASGKITLLVGDPGLGKSWITLDIAARVSRGADWPDGFPGGAPQNVLLLSAEDGLADTIRPRLDLLRADASRIHALTALRNGECDRAVQLNDVAALEQAITQREARLVIIDPISAYLGHTDSHRDADVRALIAPLAAMADRTGAAILGVMHLGKSTQRPAIYRAVGSIAFAAAARIVLAVAPDPEGDNRRIVAGVKSNLSAPPKALAYVLNDGCLVWETESVPDVDVDQLLNSPPLDREERRAADAWLHEVLANGPVRSSEIVELAEQEGISRRTLFRAKKRLGVASRKTSEGMTGFWCWEFLSPG